MRWLLCLCLCGCAEIPREEYAYQGIHLVDTLQTIQIARSDCFSERDDRYAWAIGEHPSVAGAVAWGVALAAGHGLITVWMRDHDWPRWAQQSWQAISFGGAVYDVKNNFDQGIGPFDSDC